MSSVNKDRIARRAEREIRAGQVVNLGIGIPTLIMQYLTSEKPVVIHSENGIQGMGRHCNRKNVDRNLIDAGGGYVDLEPGAAFFDSTLSFSLVRNGRLDISFLGALQISESGDLANWMIPGQYSPGIGGGMELAQKARRLVITTAHTNRNGEPKILRKCTLPLTAKGCVNRIITELAVIDVVEGQLMLIEVAEGVSVNEVILKTGAPLVIADEKLTTF
jgi:3-oxoacid CoA-transferase subunit B